MTKRSLRILVVDDNRSSADALAKLLQKGGDEVTPTYDGAAAIDHLQQEDFDLVLTDLRMEPVDGFGVLEAARAQRPPLDVIVFTAHGEVTTAVRAMRMGAVDFLTKPVTLEQLASRIDRLRAGGEDAALAGPEEFIARSSRSRELLELLQRAADVPSPVWIEGETGTGRAYAARILHGFGDKGQGLPFFVRDLARDAPWPERGTVVLPNVDDLPDDLQQHLYRQLEYAPPGVRLIATAQAGGRRQINEGSLRPDLYYRLAVVVVQVPPLRQRRDDVVPIFRRALERYAERYARPVPVISERVEARLRQHAWPGNVRELLNLAERTVVMGADTFDVEVIQQGDPDLPTLEPGFSLAAFLEHMERKILMEALRQAGGDRAGAGKLLGVERNTLRYKLNKYGLLDKAG